MTTPKEWPAPVRELVEALKECYVDLGGLLIATTWELAPGVRAQLQKTHDLTARVLAPYLESCGVADGTKVAWTDEQVMHIFVEISQGRGGHGGFLVSFAEAVSRADFQNLGIMGRAARELIAKYGLEKHLSNFKSTEEPCKQP